MIGTGIQELMTRVAHGTATDADQELLTSLLYSVNNARRGYSRLAKDDYVRQSGVLVAVLNTWRDKAPAALGGAA